MTRRALNTPDVSVIMPVRNGEAFIRKAIGSVLAQTGCRVELIVSDSGSTDGTQAIVEGYARRDRRVRLVSATGRLGPSHARNVGIDAARGEWIAIIDADDWYAPRRLAILLAAAAAANADIVADNQYFTVGEAAKPHRCLFRPGITIQPWLSVNGLLMQDTIGRTGNFGLLKPIIRREMLLKHKIRYDETISIGEDFYFLLECLLRIGDLLLFGEPLYFYRIHAHSLSTSPSSERLIPLIAAHARYAAKFDRDTHMVEARSMDRRGESIGTYIRYKMLVESLQRGNLLTALVRMIWDPAALVYLAPASWRFLSRWLSVRLPNVEAPPPPPSDVPLGRIRSPAR